MMNESERLSRQAQRYKHHDRPPLRRNTFSHTYMPVKPLRVKAEGQTRKRHAPR